MDSSRRLRRLRTHQGRVDDDAVQPRGQLGSAGESVDGSEGSEEGFLENVASIIVRADEPPCGREHAAAVLAYEQLESLRVTAAESLDERGVAGGMGGRSRLGRRRRSIAVPQELVDEAGATPQAGPVPLQTMEQGNARRVDKLQAGDVQLKEPSLGEHGFACHTQLLHGFVREATFDAKGLDAFARRNPCDPHHREVPTSQVMCRGRPRSARRREA